MPAGAAEIGSKLSPKDAFTIYANCRQENRMNGSLLLIKQLMITAQIERASCNVVYNYINYKLITVFLVSQ